MEVPLVSCILPTKNRAKYIARAIRSYQSQTYPNKELVIVDNGLDTTESLVPKDDHSIHYIKVTGKYVTGEMRNICVSHSRGEFIVHFDSDDWSGPERVTDQVTRLATFGVVTGYDMMFFHDERDGKCYRWQWARPPERLALGTSLCYRKAWWKHHPFQKLLIGEDIRFFKQACQEAARLVTVFPARHMMVARVHSHQTCHKTLSRNSYTPVPQSALPEEYVCGLTSSAT